ncbi:uncharacterized protein MELLADRAFT_91552 [Melampsora larici-populina 98AG31]|uniref:GCM domain-containing protein n=1 Tax=Melampsora larici-populina (strain 98AG31 / pathotype 3-4-7) TaxID=747676 RepID=F4RZG6_MELLP|nr:uncharacterized protein MELLADRAFT_91552 [Melampsora larici-populina 98AG31]EGG02221.1 hypothetical protein MELLADRAFT_91552 [Melampsora larici-populina 98AG31]
MSTSDMNPSQLFNFDAYYQPPEDTLSNQASPLEEYPTIPEEAPGYDEEDQLLLIVPPVAVNKDQTPETQLTIKSKKGKIGKKGKKTFALPLDRPSFTNFIDHDTTIDEEGYPKLPNGQTVFVRQPGQKFANWNTFTFTYTTSCPPKTARHPEWRTVRYHCLGVVLCGNLECKHRGSPPTAAVKLGELQKNPGICPAAMCNTTSQHIPCKDTICRVDEHLPTGWAIVRHSGVHNHPWPRRNKPDKYSLGKFAERVTNNPEMGPLQHKHVPGAGDSFPLDMIHWANMGLRMISCSYMKHKIHKTVQTQWMAAQLLARENDGGVYCGGLLSDVTYKFFANGYLMSTLMYHGTLNRWIPIQLTWLYGLSEDHYYAHFKTLMKQFKRAQLLPAERDILVRQVVDFSAAQKNGFIRAYMKVFDVTDRKEALDKLCGCQEHFRAQVMRVAKNRNVVPSHLKLLVKDQPGQKTYEENAQELRRLFPGAKRWFDWWQASDIEAMLFRSRQKQIDDDGFSKPDIPSSIVNVEVN